MYLVQAILTIYILEKRSEKSKWKIVKSQRFCAFSLRYTKKFHEKIAKIFCSKKSWNRNWIVFDNFNFTRIFFSESPEKSPKSRPKPSPSRKIPELPKEATEVSKELALFLNKKKLERQAISDVSKNVKSMIDKIQRVELASVEHVDELSERVQDLYSGFQKRLETLPVYKSKGKNQILLPLSIWRTFCALQNWLMRTYRKSWIWRKNISWYVAISNCFALQ